MGDVGHSTPDVGFTSADDYRLWLEDTLAGLGVRRPHLVGNSLGGYIAFSYAMAEPVASIVGLEPVGLAHLKLFRLMRWSMRCAMAATAPAGVRRRLATRLRQPLLGDAPAMKQLMQAQRGHPVRIPPLPVFDDEQLSGLSAPVLVMAGDRSEAFDTDVVVERVASLVPNGEVRVVPRAGHAIAISHLDECVAAIQDAIAASNTSVG